jgi:ubiquinone/menaquinone biosynthesis C-methylase UbiE
MRNSTNRVIYRLWAPVYDRVFDRMYRRGRRRALELLQPRRGDCLLIPGVGTGLDLPAIPEGVDVIGIDISPAMLRRARSKVRAGIRLEVMDAQGLGLPNASVDAVLCNLVLSVVPDGRAAMREAWRVLRPGGRVAIFDKFLPDAAPLTVRARVIGQVASMVGTDVNRRFSDILAGLVDLRIITDEPIAVRGRYRAILLEKLERPVP